MLSTYFWKYNVLKGKNSGLPDPTRLNFIAIDEVPI